MSGITATAHGAGENFPLDSSGENLDAAPQDNQADATDRRVELFFFDPEFGITPPPPGENSKSGSTQYPTWRKRVAKVIELREDDDADRSLVTFVEMADTHFRTNSAVVLPEGENPDQTAGQTPTSAGVIAAALRFNDEHSGRSLLVAGHTDTTGDVAFNQTLSEERARAVLALLTGGNASREDFKTVCDGRHTVADIKQILAWVSRTLTGFDCDPGQIDDNGGNLSGPVSNFQNAFNANSATIAPNTAALSPDGSVGPLTWGAFFDCYDFALQQEMGETSASLATLRSSLVFTDPANEFVGFSEFFPIEELGVDNFRSQQNRRVEILFFEKGEEPDVAHAAADPETSDIYLPGFFERTPVQPMLTAARLTASWQNPTASVLDGQTRNMTVLAPGLPAGSAVTFNVFQIIDNGPNQLTDTIDVVSASGSASAVFDGWYNPDLVTPNLLDFPAVTFVFTALIGDRSVQSPPLTYADQLTVVFTHSTTNQPVATTPCRVLTPWCIHDTTTDNTGTIQVLGIPPGGARVVVREFRLVAGS